MCLETCVGCNKLLFCHSVSSVCYISSFTSTHFHLPSLHLFLVPLPFFTFPSLPLPLFLFLLFPQFLLSYCFHFTSLSSPIFFHFVLILTLFVLSFILSLLLRVHFSKIKKFSLAFSYAGVVLLAILFLCLAQPLEESHCPLRIKKKKGIKCRGL